MAMSNAERQRLFRERRRAEVAADVTDDPPASVPVTPAADEAPTVPMAAVTPFQRHDAAPLDAVVTGPVEPPSDQAVPTAVTPAAVDPFADWPPALLARLDGWRKYQWDAPDRSAAVKLLVRQALGMAEPA